MATATKPSFPDTPGLTKKTEDIKTYSKGKKREEKKDLFWAVIPKEGQIEMKRKCFASESAARKWLNSHGYDDKGKKLKE